jgi:hypothetical protein
MTPKPDDIPGDWDAIAEREGRVTDPETTAGDGGRGAPPPPVALMATSWADMVVILAVCTGGLIAIMVLGQRPALPAFGWAAALAVTWWAFAAAVLVVVRQGTPGMLLAGVRFVDAVPPVRVPWVLAAALLGAVALGVPGVLGGRLSPLAAAAATRLESDG